MGTAPTDRQPPELPDAVRLVNDSLAVLQRLGLSHKLALDTIIGMAREVHWQLTDAGLRDTAWLVQVIRAAGMLAAAPISSITDREGIEHADGTGSRTGGPA